MTTHLLHHILWLLASETHLIMPIYQYQCTTDSHCEVCRNGFELLEKISDVPLDICPACKSPMRRVISAPRINTLNPNLSADNVGKKGFTQYRRIAKGQYEKTAGNGPDFLGTD